MSKYSGDLDIFDQAETFLDDLFDSWPDGDTVSVNSKFPTLHYSGADGFFIGMGLEITVE